MRSDYFLDTNKLDKAAQSRTTALSQVEINTLGCGGTATPTKMVELHKYILKKVDRHEYVDKVSVDQLLIVKPMFIHESFFEACGKSSPREYS